MKKYCYILIISALLFWVFYSASAGTINIPYTPHIEDVSIEYKNRFGGSIVDSVNYVSISLMTTIKVILSWILLIYIVYIGIQMILSLWSDEESLSSAKRQITYVLVSLVFINIPGSLFEAFYNQEKWKIWGLSGTWDEAELTGNIFLNSGAFINTINTIVGFMEMLIFGIAIMMLVIGGIRLLASGWDEEARKNAGQKIIWSIMALIFVGFIEIWKSVAISWNISGADSIWGVFGNLMDIALFWAAPIAILFLTLAGYYYITANGDEERVKKAKNTVIYTVIGTLLLLSIFTFLVDLANLF